MKKALALALTAFLLVIAFIPAYPGDDPLGGNASLSDTFSHLCGVVTGFIQLDDKRDWVLSRLPDVSCCMQCIAPSAAEGRAPPVAA